MGFRMLESEKNQTLIECMWLTETGDQREEWMRLTKMSMDFRREISSKKESFEMMIPMGSTSSRIARPTVDFVI